MRVLVLFDIPSVSKNEKRSYVRFRKALIEDGYVMMQYSIYMRFCRNLKDAQKHIVRVQAIAPKDGNIRILSVTEHQYENMILVIGEKTETEKSVGNEYVVIIE